MTHIKRPIISGEVASRPRVFSMTILVLRVPKRRMGRDDIRDHEIQSGPLCYDKERACGEESGGARGRVNTKSNKQGVVADGRRG